MAKVSVSRFPANFTKGSSVNSDSLWKEAMNREILPPEALGEIVSRLTPGYGIRFDKEPDYNLRIERFGQADLVKLNEDDSLCHVISQHDRPGAEFYFQYLEQTYFTPDTPRSQFYDFRVYRWTKWPPLLWSICSIPLDKKEALEEAAEQARMRLADGIPFICGPVVAAIRPAKLDEPWMKENATFFPLQNDNTYTLENVKGSVAYEPGGKHDVKMEATNRTRMLLEKLYGPEAWVEYQRRCGSTKKTRTGKQRFDPNPDM